MATIEGKSSAEWFKDAAQRQKRSNAYAKYEEPAKPEPARQMAAMPKPASPSAQPRQAARTKPSRVMPKPESYSMKGNRWPGRGLKYNRWDGLVPMGGDVIRPNRGYAQGSIETPNSEPAKPARPAPGQAKGSESEWTAKRTEAKGRSSLYRAQAEARKKASYKEPTKYTPKSSLADSQMGEFSKTLKKAGSGLAKALNANNPDSWISDPLGVRRRRLAAAK
jgi:hypothetical protein